MAACWLCHGKGVVSRTSLTEPEYNERIAPCPECMDSDKLLAALERTLLADMERYDGSDQHSQAYRIGYRDGVSQGIARIIVLRRQLREEATHADSQ